MSALPKLDLENESTEVEKPKFGKVKLEKSPLDFG